LEREGEVDLGNRFSLFVYAINVRKHGRGRSYDTLAAMGPNLPFRIKRPGEDFFPAAQAELEVYAREQELAEDVVARLAKLLRNVALAE
jgi:hypothetical protein